MTANEEPFRHGDELADEQTRLLLRQLPVVNLLEGACALTFVYLYWDALEKPGLLAGWGALVLGLVVLRVMVTLLVRNLAPDTARLRYWRWALMATIVATGTLFGLGAIAFNPQSLLFDPALIQAQAVCAALMVGLAIVAITSFGIYLPAAGLYLIAMTVPPIVHLWQADMEPSSLLAGIAALLLVFLLWASRRIHATTIDSLRLQFKNQSLIDYLNRARDDAQALNQKLSREVSPA